MKTSFLVSLPLVAFVFVSSSFAQVASNAEKQLQFNLYQALSTHVNDPNSPFSRWVAPGLNGSVRGTPQQQSESTIQMIAIETSAIFAAFAEAPEGQREVAALTRLAQFNPKAATERTTRLFPAGAQPPASVMRSILVVPAATLGANASQRIFMSAAAFEQLPKYDFVYYRYSQPFDLAANVIRLEGSGNSHLGQVPDIKYDNPYAVKKCTDVLFSTYCNTSHYVGRQVATQFAPVKESVHILISSLIDLTRNPDNQMFIGKDEGENTASGYTGMTFVGRAGDSVLIYFAGIQHAQSDRGFHDRLDAGFKQETEYFKQRLSALLGLRL